MSLANPTAVYAASTNQEAMLLKHLLIEAGIEADITEDLSMAGLWMGGTAPQIHNPKVWVDRTQAEAAAGILTDYEQKRFDRSKGALQSSYSQSPAPLTMSRYRATA